MDVLEEKIVQERILQVFRYLQALDQLRNPVIRDIQLQEWRLWFKDLPSFPTIQMGNFSISAQANGESNQASAPFILKVKRPELHEAPVPPQEYMSVLKDTWKKPELSVQFHLEKIPADDGKELTEDEVLEKFLQDFKFANWYEKRNQWAEKERPKILAMSVFRNLYDLYARLERESEQFELVLGDGFLFWHHPSGFIKHPILLLRLKLEFDPSVPEFTLVETDQPVELYTALFRTISEVSGIVMNRLQQELAQGLFHPLAGPETDEFFKRLITQLSPYGRYLEPGTFVKQNLANSSYPILTRDPLIFLRKRSLGYSKALQEILIDIPERKDLPGFLKNIVGVATEEKSTASYPESDQNLDPNGEDENILLSKPANAEQLQIAEYLNHHSAVLVQGPPGTGKTHTIANLIGHLLAQGKSILVTSHTSKALSVLRDKIVEPLQPLCLSVLTDDNRIQLDSAVDAITERLAGSNPDQLEKEARNLQEERLKILKQLRETRQKLLNARMDEYRPIVIAGKEYYPAQAARLIYELKDTASWIPGPVSLGAPLPLSELELIELYRTNTSLAAEDEKELAYELPDPELLLVPYEFEQSVSQYVKIKNLDLGIGKEFWKETVTSQVTAEQLESLYEELKKAVNVIVGASKWELAMLYDGMQGPEYTAIWQNLINLIETVCAKSTQIRESVLEYNPIIQDEELPNDVERILDEIIDFLQRGGSINVFKLLTKGNWRTIINQSQINGISPSRPEHFQALKNYVEIRKARAKLLERWERQVAILEGPSCRVLGAEPEYSCRQYCAQMTNAINWYNEQFNPLIQQLISIGFNWKSFTEKIPVQLGEFGELQRLRKAVIDNLKPIMSAQINRLRLKEIETKFNLLRINIEKNGHPAASVVQNLKNAVATADPVSYRTAYERLLELKGLEKEAAHRKELLSRLGKYAPAWASAIQQRLGVHGNSQVPGNAADAWLWRQLADELEERAKTSMEKLLQSITQLSEKLRQKTALLVEKKAWAAQVRRTSLEQRLALNGWKQMMHRIGKGTGKRTREFLAEARRLMPVCQSAVPVWIMPLNRVVENFNPRENRFDVVIIDEASQADVLALTALYMGNQVIVVGDKEQVSPSAVGQKQEEAVKLIEEQLKDIPNAKLYDGLFSIYDLADTAFQPIMLKEHFRCVTPIIQFSNFQCYEGKIKPLRDESTVKIRPHTVAYRVHDSMSHHKVNVKEAQVVASLVLACIEQPEYRDASLGVISLVGEEQAIAIDRILQQYMPAEDYKKRRIQCGNPAQFQGDERDIIFISMVDASAGEGPLRMRNEGAHDMFKKRFNVAASRARDQMWVVYSLDPEHDLKPGDLRGELIKHARNPHAIMRMLDTAEKETESEFEKQVLFRLRQAGYKVHPQWKVGGYRIDMVIEGGGKRVALECDGDKWHTPENLAEDMSRQAILERLGWRFIRIRGSEFFRDPDAAMQRIFERLAYYEIYPEGTSEEENSLEIQGEILKERIIRRAEEIRLYWENREGQSINTLFPKNPLEPVIAQDNKAKDSSEQVQTNHQHSDRWRKYLRHWANSQTSSQNTNSSITTESGTTQKTVDLVELLKTRGLEVIDNRSIGGTIWVIGGQELSTQMESLREQGFRFRYKAQGGRITKNRPAWYLS